jgi:hypothetical protein
VSEVHAEHNTVKRVFAKMRVAFQGYTRQLLLSNVGA